MLLHQLKIPDTARRIAIQASELLGEDHPLSTTAFEANIVYSSSTLKAGESLEQSVAMIRESVGPGLTLSQKEAEINNQTWTRVSGILREGVGATVAQVIYACTFERELIAVTYSSDIAKLPGLEGFAESHISELSLVKQTKTV